MNDQEAKSRFAEALLRYPNNAYAAAVSAFGTVPLAFKASVEWLNDPYVLTRRAELLAERGDEAFLPSKAEIAHKLLDAIEERNYYGGYRHDLKDRIAGYKVIAEMLGHMPKPGTAVNLNVVNNNRVMVVQSHGSDEDWERRLAATQAKLIEHASSTSN